MTTNYLEVMDPRLERADQSPGCWSRGISAQDDRQFRADASSSPPRRRVTTAAHLGPSDQRSVRSPRSTNCSRYQHARSARGG